MNQDEIQKMADRYKFMRDHMSHDDADIIYEKFPSDWDEYIDARIAEVKGEGKW